MEIPIPRNWPSETAEEIRQLQVIALKGRHRAIRLFKDTLATLSLPRWTQLNPPVQEALIGAIERFFKDKDQMGQWVTFLNRLPKKPVIRKKFKVMVVAIGMEVMASLAKASSESTAAPTPEPGVESLP